MLNQTDYIEQNRQGFEGDEIARERFKALIAANEIRIVVETGTFLGSTTKHFSEWVQGVYTIENNPEYYRAAQAELGKLENVQQFQGNSAEILEVILQELNPTDKVFFFLDAHWEDFNPLLDELSLIAKYGFKPIIAIHDFKVPGRPELGFDVYKDIIYEWDWIKEKVEAIFNPDPFIVEYNDQATGAKRGIVYLYPEGTKA